MSTLDAGDNDPGILLEHRPAGMCVVLASRSDPPLPLARLRARGLLAEVRVAELRFRPEVRVAELRFRPAEAAVLLRQVASALPDGSVAARPGQARRGQPHRGRRPGL